MRNTRPVDPDLIALLSTTNLVEAITGQLEVLRRNSGGYFQSEESMKLKLGLSGAGPAAAMQNRCVRPRM